MNPFSESADGSTQVRLPPQDLLAEQATLGSILLEEGAADIALSRLDDGDFYREAHRIIYRAMQAVWRRSQPVDLITVSAELRTEGLLDEVGGPEYLIAIIGEVATTAHVARYAGIVREKSTLRKLIAMGMELAAECYDSPDDVQAILEACETRIMEIMANRHAGRGAIHVSDMLEDGPVEQILEMAKQDANPTERPLFGLPDLDLYLGGLHIPSLVTVLGFTGFGKSTICAMLADYWAVERNRPVAWYTTGEETKLESVRRVAGIRRKLNLSPSGIRHYLDAYTEDWLKDELAIGVTETATSPLFINDRVLDFDEWASDVRELRRRHGVELVLLDYLERLDPGDERQGNKVARMERMAKRAHRLTSDLEICLVAPSQVSQDLDGETRARFCAALENNGHLNLRLAGERGGTQEDQRAHNRYHLIVRKHRFGESGGRFLVERHYGAFRQVSEAAAPAPKPTTSRGKGLFDGEPDQRHC